MNIEEFKKQPASFIRQGNSEGLDGMTDEEISLLLKEAGISKFRKHGPDSGTPWFMALLDSAYDRNLL